MTNNGDYERNHESYLRRQEIIWQTYFDARNQTDRGAVDIGIAALKTVVLINAGALVALIAFVAQIWQADGGQAVIKTFYLFLTYSLAA